VPPASHRPVIDPRATLPARTHRPGSAAPQLQHQPLCAERHHGHRGPRKVQHLVECSCDAHVPGPLARQPSTAPNVGPPARARHPATRLGADHGGTYAQAQRRPVLARQRPPGQASASPCCPLTPEPAGSRSRAGALDREGAGGMQRHHGSTPGNERAEGAPSCPPRWHPPQLPLVKQHKPIGANGRREGHSDEGAHELCRRSGEHASAVLATAPVHRQQHGRSRPDDQSGSEGVDGLLRGLLPHGAVSCAPSHQHLPAAVDHEEVPEAQTWKKAIQSMSNAAANQPRYFAHWAWAKPATR